MFRSRLTAAMALAALLTAAVGCHSATAPKGTDPSVLITTDTPDSVWLTWATDQGLQTVVLAPYTTTCTRWTQSFDSLYVYVRDSVAGQAPWATSTTPWLHFSDYPYYFQLDTVFGGHGYSIAQHIVASEC